MTPKLFPISVNGNPTFSVFKPKMKVEYFTHPFVNPISYPSTVAICGKPNLCLESDRFPPSPPYCAGQVPSSSTGMASLSPTQILRAHRN